MTLPTWRRGRYQISPSEFLRALSIEGELISITHDPVTGWVDVITCDPAAEPSFVGGWIEPKTRLLETTEFRHEVASWR